MVRAVKFLVTHGASRGPKEEGVPGDIKLARKLLETETDTERKTRLNQIIDFLNSTQNTVVD